MEENSAAVSGEGVKQPELAEPAPQEEKSQPGPALPEEKSRRERSEDAKYAAARRKAEAERDEALARVARERQAEQQALEEEHRALQAEQQQTRQARARLIAEQQIREIAGIDGSVQSMEDLLAMENYEDFYALVKKGMSLTEAYKLCHYERLMQRQADRAARQTMVSLASRQHMTALAGGAGTGDYSSVPAEVAAQFRLAKPGITDGEIRKKYRKYQKYKRQ